MLYVHWTGIAKSKTVIVLSRDSRPNSESTSYLYVSNDYGKRYFNQSHKLNYTRGGTTKQGLIEKFYPSPKHHDWVSIFTLLMQVSFVINIIHCTYHLVTQ